MSYEDDGPIQEVYRLENILMQVAKAVGGLEGEWTAEDLVARVRLLVDPPPPFSMRLAEFREAKGMSLRDAALLLGVPHPQIINYEQGQGLPTRPETIANIERVFPGLWRGANRERAIHKAHRLRRQIALLEAMEEGAG